MVYGSIINPFLFPFLFFFILYNWRVICFMNQHFLTPRELEIFKLLIENKTTKEIAISLSISEKTVRNHISNVIGKLGVSSRSQAIIILIKNGLIQLNE